MIEAIDKFKKFSRIKYLLNIKKNIEKSSKKIFKV
jgi:hypothetical protein